MNFAQRMEFEHRILPQKQIEAIHCHALHLLERVGVCVQSKEALDIQKRIQVAMSVMKSG